MSLKTRRSAESTPAWALALGAAVRAQRKALRLTQKELADLSQCGPDFLYDLERGKPTLRLDKLVPVLEMLGLRLKLEARVAGGNAGFDTGLNQGLETVVGAQPGRADP